MDIFGYEFLLGVMKGSGYIFATIVIPFLVKLLYKKPKTTLNRRKRKGGSRR